MRFFAAILTAAQYTSSQRAGHDNFIMVKLNIIALIQLILLAQISFAAPINGPNEESQTTRAYIIVLGEKKQH